MPEYHCQKCKFDFRIDWNRQTLCADCHSIEERNAREDPESSCGHCGSYSFIFPFDFTSNIACPKCGYKLEVEEEEDDWDEFKIYSK
ncbi:MAG: hypothetical protein ACFFBD_10495 [Candidatus Hodarchaeota archaeon]